MARQRSEIRGPTLLCHPAPAAKSPIRATRRLGASAWGCGGGERHEPRRAWRIFAQTANRLLCYPAPVTNLLIHATRQVCCTNLAIVTRSGRPRNQRRYPCNCERMRRTCYCASDVAIMEEVEIRRQGSPRQIVRGHPDEGPCE